MKHIDEIRKRVKAIDPIYEVEYVPRQPYQGSAKLIIRQPSITLATGGITAPHELNIPFDFVSPWGTLTVDSLPDNSFLEWACHNLLDWQSLPRKTSQMSTQNARLYGISITHAAKRLIVTYVGKPDAQGRLEYARGAATFQYGANSGLYRFYADQSVPTNETAWLASCLKSNWPQCLRAPSAVAMAIAAKETFAARCCPSVPEGQHETWCSNWKAY